MNCQMIRALKINQVKRKSLILGKLLQETQKLTSMLGWGPFKCLKAFLCGQNKESGVINP